MPYLVYVPQHPDPYLLSDCDANYLRYFSLWGWRIETVDPSAPGLPKTPVTPGEAMLEPFEASALYGLWKEGMRVRIQEEEKNGVELRDLVKAKNKQGGGEGKKEGKRGLRGLFKLVGKKGRKGEGGEEMEVNHLEDLQRMWS